MYFVRTKIKLGATKENKCQLYTFILSFHALYPWEQYCIRSSLSEHVNYTTTNQKYAEHQKTKIMNGSKRKWKSNDNASFSRSQGSPLYLCIGLKNLYNFTFRQWSAFSLLSLIDSRYRGFPCLVFFRWCSQKCGGQWSRGRSLKWINKRLGFSH